MTLFLSSGLDSWCSRWYKACMQPKIASFGPDCVYTDDGESVETRGEAMIVEHFAFNRGRPISAFDLVNDQVGRERGANEHWIRTTAGYMLRSEQSLYDEDCRQPGRPLRFTLEEARAIKRAYWDGEKTQAELAREHRVTVRTISKLVHGLTMWYVSC